MLAGLGRAARGKAGLGHRAQLPFGEPRAMVVSLTGGYQGFWTEVESAWQDRPAALGGRPLAP